MRNDIDIHADDYAYSVQTSKDILDCVKTGALDSFSIICNTKDFEDSVRLLYETIPSLPYLPLLSVHLNIPEGIFEDERFPMGWGKLFLASYTPGRKEIKEKLKKEFKRQIEKSQAVIDRSIEIAKQNGIQCEQSGMRLDSHVHTHLIPVVWDALIELIEEENYDVEYIRNPKEPIMPFLKNVSLWSSYSLVNIIKNRILMLYSGKADRYLESHGMAKMYMWGLMMSGHMDIDRIEKLFHDMRKTAEDKGRKLELLFHPGRAASEEYSIEKNPDYFKEFNSSENRSIEKEAVMNIKKVLENEKTR